MDVECVICYNRLEDPLVLNCTHTYCKSCLLRLNHYVCPICRAPFTLGDDLTLSPCFEKIAWMGQNKPQEQTPKVTCQVCEQSIADFWCENCSGYLCITCDQSEHSGKLSKNHRRLTIIEISTKPAFFSCLKHQHEKEYFCIDDQLFLCHICVVDDHKFHNTISVFKYADNMRDELKKQAQPLSDRYYLEKKEAELREEKRKNEVGLLKIEKEAEILKENIIKLNIEIENILECQQKIKNVEVVVMKSIDDLQTSDLLNQEHVVVIQKKINEVIQNSFPEKERLEKERLEKERFEKERLEKEKNEFAICNITSLEIHLSNGWDIVNFIDLQYPDKWNSFAQISSKDGLICLDNFEETNPLPHINNENQELGFFFCSDKYVSTNQYSKRQVGERIILREHDTFRSLTCFPRAMQHKPRVYLKEGHTVILKKNCKFESVKKDEFKKLKTL